MKNIEMEQAVDVLKKHLERCDVLGYAAARNIRILSEELTEYISIKNDLIRKYGTEDDSGNYVVEIGTQAFNDFVKEVEKFAVLEHEPKLYMIEPKDVIGGLTGTEILEIDWMIAEE